MTSFSKASLAETWDKVRAELSHAFSSKPEAEVFTVDDLALLERVADAVVKRGMAAPATMTGISRSLNFLDSQALYFLTPIVEWALTQGSQASCSIARYDGFVSSIKSLTRSLSPGSSRSLRSMSVPSPAPIKPVLTHPLNVIVATDCGSTTTKAILIEKVGDEYRQTFRGEAPTTVEAPFEDVTRGVLNAIAEIEELSGRKILDGDKILTPNRAAQGDPKTGVDIYISTSSAGGGLQMMVTGWCRT
jgi:hypothetical protein